MDRRQLSLVHCHLSFLAGGPPKLSGCPILCGSGFIAEQRVGHPSVPSRSAIYSRHEEGWATRPDSRTISVGAFRGIVRLRSHVSDLLMKRLLLILALSAGCLAQTITISQAPVITPNPAKYESVGVPGLIRTNSGKLLSFYRQGTQHTGERGVQMLRTSADDGLTWTPYSGANFCLASDSTGCIFADTSPIDVNLIAGGLMPDGSISVCVAYYDYTLNIGATGYLSHSARCSRSMDDGASWSAPAVLMEGSHPLHAIPYGGIVNGANSSVAIVMLRLNDVGFFPGSDALKLMWSYDNGQTWGVTLDATRPGFTQITNSRRQLFGLDNGETAFICKNNKLVGMSRNGLNRPLGFYGLSLWALWKDSCDPGSTAPWYIAEGVDLPAHAIPEPWASQGYHIVGGAMFISPWVIDPGLSSGELLVIYGERLFIASGSTLRCPVFLRAFLFNPATVLASQSGDVYPQAGFPQTVIDLFVDDGLFAATDFGYPSAAMESNGEILVQFNSESATHPWPNRAQLYTMKLRLMCGAQACIVNTPPPPPPPVCTRGVRASCGRMADLRHRNIIVKSSRFFPRSVVGGWPRQWVPHTSVRLCGSENAGENLVKPLLSSISR